MEVHWLVMISTVRSDGRTRRWFKEAHVEPFAIANESGWIIKLDKHTIRTPQDNRFIIPSEKLAHAIAAEWDAQEKLIKPQEMPLVRAKKDFLFSLIDLPFKKMSIAATATDLIPSKRSVVIDNLMSFLKTDIVM